MIEYLVRKPIKKIEDQTKSMNKVELVGIRKTLIQQYVFFFPNAHKYSPGRPKKQVRPQRSLMFVRPQNTSQKNIPTLKSYIVSFLTAME